MIFYSDGACKTSNISGGWAFVVVKDEEKVHSAFGPVENTTNNRMEIMASVKALEYCVKNSIDSVTLITDSMYVIGTMSEGWKRNKNEDLWPILDELSEKINVTWKHVKGHAGQKWNELCDILAVTASNYYKPNKNKK